MPLSLPSRLAQLKSRDHFLRTYAAGVRALAMVDRKVTTDLGVKWLFIAALPNSGSTVLGKILATSASAAALTPSAEGQWLIPEMSRQGNRWNPAHHPNYATVRRVWLSRVRLRRRPVVVVEKSPPNTCRMRELVAAFAPMEVRVVRLVRAPYATCASWAKRYAPKTIEREWRTDLRGQLGTEDAFYRALGDTWGRMAGMLRAIEDIAQLTVTYEQMTDDPERWVPAFGKIFAELSDVSPRASVEVKDYAPQGLSNMNADQVGTLTNRHIALISEGLAAHAETASYFGYELRAR